MGPHVGLGFRMFSYVLGLRFRVWVSVWLKAVLPFLHNQSQEVGFQDQKSSMGLHVGLLFRV